METHRLRFHQAAVELLPEAPQFSPENANLLDAREKKLGIAFPAAVREWYSLEGPDDLLREHSNADFPTALGDLGEPIPDWYGSGTRDFVAQKLLHVLNENQGSANWAVRLDGGDDPEVVVEVETAPDEVWLPHVEKFSAFIFTRIWDWRLYPFQLQARDGKLESRDLGFLRKNLQEGPRTYHWPGRTNHRFTGPGGRVLVWDDEEGQADWHLLAESEGGLEALARTVWGCGGLKGSLQASDDRAAGVLKKIRGT